MDVFGRTSGGWFSNDLYRSIPSEFTNEVYKARSQNSNPAFPAPLPCGWTFYVIYSHLILEPGPDESHDFKYAYGFSAAINEASRNDAETPICLQAIRKMRFKHGVSVDEYKRSWVFARVNAFPPKCIPVAPFPLFSHPSSFLSVWDSTNTAFPSLRRSYGRRRGKWYAKPD